MRGVNKVIVVGTVGQDPEMRYASNGNAIVNLSLATSEKWKDKHTGEAKEETEWHSVTMFGRVAEIAGEYLRKGSKAYIEGKLKTRKWQDKDTGADRYATEIVAHELQLLSSKENSDSEQRPAAAPKARKPAASEPFDDETIPF